MRHTLFEFCNISGQRVSLSKSQVFVSPNTSRDVLNQVHCRDACHKELGEVSWRATNSWKGFSENLCRFLRESARSGWKAKLLNMAGRETLIQSTTFALPMYTMQTALLPQKVCDELDRMNWNFLWGSTDEKGKVHLVGWHHITKSRFRGGLGIRSARRCKSLESWTGHWTMVRKGFGFFCWWWICFG